MGTYVADFFPSGLFDIDRAPYETLHQGVRRFQVIADKIFLKIVPDFVWAAAILLLVLHATPAHTREKNVLQYGAGLIVNIPSPEPDVARAVEEVAQNTIIRGTTEYNKDEYVSGAAEAKSTPLFPVWTEGGKVFYKVRKQALNPINFKNSNDIGTLAVRYVVQPQGDKNSVLRIDAIFMEDFRHVAHPSNGSVESSEYRQIQDKIQAVDLLKKETAEAVEAKKAKQEQEETQKFGMGSDTTLLSTPPPATERDTGAIGSSSSKLDQPPPEPDMPLEQRVADLRRQVERLVKQPGAPLKSAPYRTASTLKSLDPGVEVMILISTKYWLGVETHEGQHGWLRRDQVEDIR
jgi:hypothetical protein